MSKHNSYDDDEYSSYYDKTEYSRNTLHGKGAKKYKGKGHQSRRGESDYWAEFMAKQDVDLDTNIPDEPAPAPVQPQPQPQAPRPQRPKGSLPNTDLFVPGPNTHTIKGNVIDFDRVASIDKVDAPHDGHTTYGIKFLFTGKKGSFRMVWFNQNARERDAVYNREYAFWKSLSQA